MSPIPKTIRELKFAALTFVINDEAGKTFAPVNPDARLVAVEKARRVGPRTILEAIKQYAPTKTGREIAHKAQSASKPVTFAFKSIDSGRREVVGCISRANVLDRQNEIVTPDALHDASVALAAAVGSKGVAIDQNHDPTKQLPDVVLKQVWFSGSSGVGDRDSLYARFGFAPDSPTWNAILAGKCSGFSWSGPVTVM